MKRPLSSLIAGSKSISRKIHGSFDIKHSPDRRIIIGAKHSSLLSTK